MMDFILNNHISIMAGLFLGFHIVGFAYDKFAKKQTRDDWFEVLTMNKVIKKNYVRHPGFVGTRTSVGTDKFFLSQDKEGNPERKPYAV